MYIMQPHKPVQKINFLLGVYNMLWDSLPFVLVMNLSVQSDALFSGSLIIPYQSFVVELAKCGQVRVIFQLLISDGP